MLPASFLQNFDEELGFIVLQTRREDEMRRQFDTNKLTKAELTKALDDADKQAGTTERTTRWEGETLVVEWGPSQAPPIQTVRITVGSPIDRLKDKLHKASGVAMRVATQVESEADALIAREDQLKAKTTQAFGAHKAVLDAAHSELDQVENALNLMSNGGPALDPLPESAPVAHN